MHKDNVFIITKLLHDMHVISDQLEAACYCMYVGYVWPMNLYPAAIKTQIIAL